MQAKYLYTLKIKKIFEPGAGPTHFRTKFLHGEIPAHWRQWQEGQDQNQNQSWLHDSPISKKKMIKAKNFWRQLF